MRARKPKHNRRIVAASRGSLEQLIGRADSHYTAGELDSAERLYREVLAQSPSQHRAVFMLGMIEYLRRNYTSARAWLENAIALHGSTAEYWLFHGRTLEALQQHAAALVHFKRARQLDAQLLEAWLCEGRLFRKLGAPAQAQATYDAAAIIHGQDAVLHAHLGELALGLGQLDEAGRHFDAALKLDPKLVAALINLGVVHQRSGRLEQARSCYARACEVDPSSVVAHANLGWTLQRLGLLAAAEASLRRALTIDPDYSAALVDLATVLHELGEIDEALRCYRRALERSPNPAHHSSMIALMLYDTNTPPAAVLDEARRWAERYAPGRDLPGHDLAALTASPRLRIGYVSADFREHAVMHFIEPLIAAHDRSRFEVVCYSNGKVSDSVTARIAQHARFQSIRGLNDEQVADQIRTDGIHILIDLMGHTTDHRLAVFSRSPAPIQATYVGYPGTTGVPTIGYRFTDALADPEPLADAQYSEQLVRMPGGFCCFSPLHAAPAVNALPRLERGYITFGSLNNYTKLSDEVLNTWTRVMAELPGSRLILQSRPFEDPAICERVHARFAARGITAERVALHGTLSYVEHLALYNQIDIALDTFPWNGHTTTCLSLHMGVPVVVVEGDRFGSRMGQSVLTRVGLTDWIARDIDHYVALGVAHARDVERLSHLRGNLRDQLARSPLGDAATFTREMEALYERLWQHYRSTRNAGTPSV